MSNLSTIFTKIQQNCSNAFLIDENLCLSNSLDLINTNFLSLSSAISAIQQTADHLNNVYTLFVNNSAAWFQGNSNIKTFSSTWDRDLSTVSSLSATWTNEFGLYYTTMYNVTEWNDSYSNNQVLNWLNSNFPISNFPNNQIVSVYVNLYEIYNFNMTNYQTSYSYDCHVPQRSSSVGCNAGCPKPSRGCNHHGGAAGSGPCTNAYDGCSVTVSGPQNVSYTCQGYNGATMYLPDSPTIDNRYDRFCTKSIRIRYIKYPNTTTWTKL